MPEMTSTVGTSEYGYTVTFECMNAAVARVWHIRRVSSGQSEQEELSHVGFRLDV